jgi:hypothetical protein
MRQYKEYSVIDAVSVAIVVMQWFGNHVPTLERGFLCVLMWRLGDATLVIFGSQFQRRRVASLPVPDEKWIQWQFQFSDEWIIVTAEARKKDSELGLGAQKKTRGQPVKNWRVIRRHDLRVIFRLLWLHVLPPGEYPINRVIKSRTYQLLSRCQITRDILCQEMVTDLYTRQYCFKF